MNIHFEAALRYIDLGNEEKAIEELKTAIENELDAGDEVTSMEYRCVLAEYYANIGMKDEAIENFGMVLDFCDSTNLLGKQREIAFFSLNYLEGRLPVDSDNVPVNRPSASSPIIAKPVQNRAFIEKQLRKK